jgi:hypothetical protein
MKFLTDEDFNGVLIKSFRRMFPSSDLVRVVECGLRNQPDPIVLEFAANEGRILLTHDRNTITPPAEDRIHRGFVMPGVLVPAQTIPVREFLNEMDYILNAGDPRDFENRIPYLPLRA